MALTSDILFDNRWVPCNYVMTSLIADVTSQTLKLMFCHYLISQLAKYLLDIRSILNGFVLEARLRTSNLRGMPFQSENREENDPKSVYIFLVRGIAKIRRLLGAFPLSHSPLNKVLMVHE